MWDPEAARAVPYSPFPFRGAEDARTVRMVVSVRDFQDPAGVIRRTGED